MAQQKRNNDQLFITCFLEEPLYDSSQLCGLEQVLSETMPCWRTAAYVAKGERMRNAVKLTDGISLSDSVKLASPAKFGLGSAVITGAEKGIQIYLFSCRSTLPPELNYISIEATGEHLANPSDLSDWAVGIFRHLCSVMPVRYGCSYLAGEYCAKNLVRSGGKVEAIGVKLDYSLPGLYWLNFFGSPYVKLIGQDRLLSCPTERCLAEGHGVILQLSENPNYWETTDYAARVDMAIHHLGRDFFFLRAEPEFPTRAPNFREERRARK